MTRKNIVLTSIGLVLIGTIIVLFYNQLQYRQEPKVYNFAIETKDLRINDIEFVTYPNSLYLADHHLEVVGDNKHFSGVAYAISINGQAILSLSQADDPFTLPDSFQGRMNYSTRNLFQGVKVGSSDSVDIEIVYKVNGVDQNVTGTVNIRDIMKSTDHKNIIRL